MLVLALLLLVLLLVLLLLLVVLLVLLLVLHVQCKDACRSISSCIMAAERLCICLLCLRRVGAWPCEDNALKGSQWAQGNLFMHSVTVVLDFLSSIGHYH